MKSYKYFNTGKYQGERIHSTHSPKKCQHFRQHFLTECRSLHRPTYSKHFAYWAKQVGFFALRKLLSVPLFTRRHSAAVQQGCNIIFYPAIRLWDFFLHGNFRIFFHMSNVVYFLHQIWDFWCTSYYISISTIVFYLYFKRHNMLYVERRIFSVRRTLYISCTLIVIFYQYFEHHIFPVCRMLNFTSISNVVFNQYFDRCILPVGHASYLTCRLNVVFYPHVEFRIFPATLTWNLPRTNKSASS